MKILNIRHRPALWVILAFLVWLFAFRGFLSSRLALINDALSYFDHTKFFIENLRHGIFPLWDPFWFHGVPNAFFLRRIGAFNPFYLAIVLLRCAGVPYDLAYVWFLAGYYWMGMVGFYLLAKRLYQNQLMAYAGYLVLLFSALGTRLFDSYMMLVTVPLIWFFYFLVVFAQAPRRYSFFGLCLSFMILAGTYIPFYFLSFLAFFLLCYGLFYGTYLPVILRRWWSFFRTHQMAVVLSGVVVLAAFLPAAMFFHSSASGQVVLPIRHGNAAAGQALAVPRVTLDWGAVEDLVYSAYFSDLSTYKFAIVFVPVFAFIALALGLVGRISRAAALLFVCGLAFFCCIIPHGLPLYDFLYKHVFFLKYFRNLHFFLWFVLIPLLVLLALEHWKLFTDIKTASPASRQRVFIYAQLVHAAALLFIWGRHDAIAGTYVALAFSDLFWSLLVLGRLKVGGLAFAILTLAVVPQSLQVYHGLAARAGHNQDRYDYNFSYTSLPLEQPILPLAEVSQDKPELYYASSEYNFIYQNLSNQALANYLQGPLMLVDRVQVMKRDKLDTDLLESTFLQGSNRAFIFQDQAAGARLAGDDPHPPLKALRLDTPSLAFKILKFNANTLLFEVRVPYQKFLVYNDSYDPHWQVKINEKSARLYETNAAFKGVWLPAGDDKVEFHYGAWWQYALNIFLSVAALAFLLGVIRYAFLP